jgi:hypothetical protein
MEVTLSLDEQIKQISNENIRLVIVVVEGEALVLDQVSHATNSWKEDLAKLSLEKESIVLFKASDPCDLTNCVCIHYIPSYTSVRSKMMYSLAKRLLVKQFEVNHTLVLEQGDTLSPALLESAMNKVRVYTEKELEQQAVVKEQVSMAVGASATHQSCSLSFPLDPGLNAALSALSKGSTLVLDIQNQVFVLIKTIQCSYVELPSLLPANRPLFFVYYAEDQSIFGYLSPIATPIKDRMLYAASKNSIITYIEGILSTTFKRVLLTDTD